MGLKVGLPPGVLGPGEWKPGFAPPNPLGARTPTPSITVFDTLRGLCGPRFAPPDDLGELAVLLAVFKLAVFDTLRGLCGPRFAPPDDLGELAVFKLAVVLAFSSSIRGNEFEIKSYNLSAFSNVLLRNLLCVEKYISCLNFPVLFGLSLEYRSIGILLSLDIFLPKIS